MQVGKGDPFSTSRSRSHSSAGQLVQERIHEGASRSGQSRPSNFLRDGVKAQQKRLGASPLAFGEVPKASAGSAS